MLAHCAAGLGRTGHFILIMLILKQYDSIFDSSSPATCAQKIHDILNTMRKVRPRLINTKSQFTNAIRNAYAVGAYTLENHYIQTDVHKKYESDESCISYVLF